MYLTVLIFLHLFQECIYSEACTQSPSSTVISVIVPGISKDNFTVSVDVMFPLKEIMLEWLLAPINRVDTFLSVFKITSSSLPHPVKNTQEIRDIINIFSLYKSPFFSTYV